MKSNPRIVVLPADEAACGLVRLRYPAAAVRQVRPDWSIEIYRPGDVSFLRRDGNLAGVFGLPDPESVDLLVMQRPDRNTHFHFIRWAQQHGIAVVVDSDDAMWCIDRKNVAWSGWNDRDGEHHWRHLDAAMELADLVTVTTPYLARRWGKHGRVEVLPNCVPAEATDYDAYSVRTNFPETIAVGWAGTTMTHPGDLTVVGDAVRRIVAEHGVTVRVVGDADGAARDWGLTGVVEQIGPTDVGEAYYQALTTLDVGLVPLRDTPFNRGKSALKALEFAAVGVPVVASPTPANVALKASGVPIMLASTPDEWYDAINYLVGNAGMRALASVGHHQAVREWWTYESHAEAWARAWERAMERRARLAA